MVHQQRLRVREPGTADHEHTAYRQRAGRRQVRSLEEMVEGPQVGEGAHGPALVGVGSRLQHAAHVQHAHERSVLVGHRVHRGLAEPRGNRQPPLAPAHLAPPLRKHSAPSVSPEPSPSNRNPSPRESAFRYPEQGPPLYRLILSQDAPSIPSRRSSWRWPRTRWPGPSRRKCHSTCSWASPHAGCGIRGAANPSQAAPATAGAAPLYF